MYYYSFEINFNNKQEAANKFNPQWCCVFIMRKWSLFFLSFELITVDFVVAQANEKKVTIKPI